MSSQNKTKTEHSGAKNGGGHWGKRSEAKAITKKLHRSNNKRLIRKIRHFLKK
jgi:hypothetical protein